MTDNGIMTEEQEVSGVTGFICIVLAGLLMTYCYFTAAEKVEENRKAQTNQESSNEIR